MEWLSLAVLGLLIVISPGADFILVLKNSVNRGRKAGVWTALGVSLAICVHIAYSMLGISYLISQNEVLFNAVRYAGCGYLFYLGVKGIVTAGANPEVEVMSDSPKEVAVLQCLAQGFLCNLLNPKTMLFFLSIFSQVITPDASGNGSALLYGLYMMALHGLWFCMLAMLFTSSALQQHLLSMKKRLNQACGAGLLTFSALLAIKT
ncbi:LysE family translocator [Oceanimonas doudoroffii]|uniref:Lysine transporter LysE n=1 Tax=Oceanimonas doudoroffii TaxID=84158 RepID=A0A233RFJ3_9GAMM|nr:LysE family translocator [Oceanimonas doudoroffii]OXY82168.1 lysine transporter LysE [Oceanimonas doudoroffii]